MPAILRDSLKEHFNDRSVSRWQPFSNFVDRRPRHFRHHLPKNCENFGFGMARTYPRGDWVYRRPRRSRYLGFDWNQGIRSAVFWGCELYANKIDHLLSVGLGRSVREIWREGNRIWEREVSGWRITGKSSRPPNFKACHAVNRNCGGEHTP